MISPETQRLLDAVEGVAYLVNAAGIVVACGRPGWERALRQCGSTVHLPVDSVLGRPLLGFIAGSAVRESYLRHMERAASMPGRPRTFECHCDTPDLSRVLRMSISALRDAGDAVAGFLFQSVVVRAEERVPVPLFAFAPPAGPKNGGTAPAGEVPFLGLCSYCQRVRFPPGSDEASGEWIEAADYYRRGGDNTVVISHGVCPACFETVVQDNLRAALATAARPG